MELLIAGSIILILVITVLWLADKAHVLRKENREQKEIIYMLREEIKRPNVRSLPSDENGVYLDKD